MNRLVRIAVQPKNLQKCNIEGCERNVKSRGLCSVHYNQYERLVKKGDTKWSELERQGIASPTTEWKGYGYQGQRCVTKNCYKPAVTRGLCKTCYERLKSQVKRGRTTWEELEAQGMALSSLRELYQQDPQPEVPNPQPEVPDRPSTNFINDQLCMLPNCNNNARSRGLCHNHYQYYSTRIKKNQTTWEELEAQGLCKPPVPADTPPARYDQLCLTPNCGKPAKLRGLCRSCYSRLEYLIRKEGHTWEALEAQGLALPKVIKYPDQNAEYPDFQYETYQETGVPELTWEDREFLVAVNYKQGMNQFPEEIFNKAYQMGWLEQENGQWWLSDLGAKVMEEFNRNLFADTDYPISDY